MAPGRKRGASKSKAKGQLILGDLVLAKVKGFPAWPAKISRPEDWDRVPDPKKYFVQFFGTEEIAFVALPDIQAFTSEAKSKLLERCQGKTVKYFAQAVKEICTAFEELQSHKSNILGNKDSLDVAEPGLTKAEIVDGTDHIVTESDGTDNFDSRGNPCFPESDKNNGEETKAKIGKRDSSSFLESKITTTSSSSQSLEHGSYDSKIKEEDLDNRTDANACTEHFGNGQQKLANGKKIKKVACGSDRKGEDAVQRDKRNNPHVPGVRAASGSSDPKKSKGLLTEKSCSKVSAGKDQNLSDFKGGVSAKKRSREIEPGKPALRVDECSHAAKRPRKESANDKEKREIDDDSKHETVLGLSARSGNLQYDNEVVAYTKRWKQTVENATSPFSGSRDKSMKGHLEQKDSSPPVSNVKVPSAHPLKKRRTVCLYDDDDDDDPKTPLHGRPAIVPKAASVSTDGLKSTNMCHGTSTKAKKSAGSTKGTELRKLPLRKHCEDAPRVLPGNAEDSTNDIPMVKPINDLHPKDVKQILRSPKTSPQLVLSNKHLAGQQKVAKTSVKVSGAVMAKKPQSDSCNEAVTGSNQLSSSQSQPANQRHKSALVGEKRTEVSKAALYLNDTDVLRDTSADLSGGMIDLKREKWSAPFTSAKTPDSAASMKDLIAAAQAKRKLAHSQNSVFGNLNTNFLSINDTLMRSHSPLVQNPLDSAAVIMPVVVQGHQQDSSQSNHGHKSSSKNQSETDGNEEKKLSSDHKSAGGSLSGGIEAAVSRDAFEGMIETLSRTRESIGRATRLAIDCAKHGLASEVVELLIRKLENESNFHRKVDLFFLVDSITQHSHSQKGVSGASYVPTVQAALPRLLRAAAPPGTAASDNRHKCLKVLKLWLERKVFPESLLRRYIDDIRASGDDTTVGFSLRRPSRSERAVDDPLREMEGMLVDEYGSNATFKLPGFFSSHNFEDDEDDDDLPTSPKAKSMSVEERCNTLDDLDVHHTSSDKCHQVLEDVDHDLEMEDVSGQRKYIAPSSFCENKSKEQSQDVMEPVAEKSTQVPPLPEDSPPLPHDSPPSPPPLPPSPPPPSPPPLPSSPPPLLLPLPPTTELPPLPSPPSQPPPPPPLSPPPSPPPPPPPPLPSKSMALPPSFTTQPSIASHHQLPLQRGFPPPAFPLSHSHQTYQGSVQQDRCSIFTVTPIIHSGDQIVQGLGSSSRGSHVEGLGQPDFFVQQSTSFSPAGVCSSREPSSFTSQNQRFQPSTPLPQRPLVRLPSAPSSHFSYPNHVQSQSQHSYTHPYTFPQRDDGRRYRNEEPWRMPASGHHAESQSGAWIRGRNSRPDLPRVADAFFRPPPEHPPSGTVSYQPSATSNLQAVPAIPGRTASQLLPSRPDLPTVDCWRPA